MSNDRSSHNAVSAGLRVSKRRTLTRGQKQDILVRERWTCRYCKQPIHHDDKIEFDHTQALARGGADDLENIAPLHRECHVLKTYHPRSRATTIGSDIFETCKPKRIKRKQEKPRGPGKIKSRGFSRWWKRKIDGTTEKRE